MILGAVIGGIVGFFFGLSIGEVSRAVAPEPIRASFVAWLALTTLAGAVPGAVLGWLITLILR